MAMNRAAFPKELRPGLHALFGLEYARYPDEWKGVFEINKSDKAVEEEQGLSGLGYASEKAEGGPVALDQGFETYTARYQNVTMALAFNITEEAMEDNLYASLSNRYTKALARSMKESKELMGADILNNAFSSSVTYGDGKELCATDHPSGAGNQSNELSTPAQLSETSYEDLCNLIFQAKDWRGLPVRLNPVGLIVPRKSLTQQAARIAMSPLRPATGDNDINASKMMGLIDKTMPLTNLTSSTVWFIKTDCPDSLKYMDRVKLATKSWSDDITGNMFFRARERYVFGATDFRGIYGSNAS